MSIFITPKFEELFQETPDVEKLLENIPSRIVLQFLAFINAQLDDGPADKILINFFCTKLSDPYKKEFEIGVSTVLRKYQGKPIIFFGKYYVLKFMMNEIINYREFDFDEQNTKLNYNLLKAYFAFAKNVQKELDNSFNLNVVEHKNNFFNKKTWPLILSQFELSIKPDLAFQAVRALVFFDELSSFEITKSFVLNYLHKTKYKSYKQYILIFIGLCSMKSKGNIV